MATQISMPVPPPYVYAYKVGRLKYVVDENGKIRPVWASKPQPVNTEDIESTLRQPDTFLLEWQEVHPQMKYQQVKGNVIPLPKEDLITKSHAINTQLVLYLTETYNKAARLDGMAQLPKIRSYEKMLFDLGWKFHWEPTGQEDVPGAIFDERTRLAMLEQPEIKAIFHPESTGIMGEVISNALTSLSSDPPESTPPIQPPADFHEDRLSRIERSIEALTGLMAQLFEPVGGNDDPPNHDSRGD